MSAVAVSCRHARREVPLDHALVLALRDRHEATGWPGGDDLVLPAGNGAYLHVGNTRRRVLKPVRERACLEWVGFHTFRHTCATLLFALGVSRTIALGTTSASAPMT
jgi:integrase